MATDRVFITPGEPSGIGGEILIKCLHEGAGHIITRDDPDRLSRLADEMGKPVAIKIIETAEAASDLPERTLGVIPMSWPETPVPGKPSTANARSVIDSITLGAELARDGRILGLVTNPIQKSTLYSAGFKSPGHTEYLALIDRPPSHPVMMLVSPMLRVVPLTIHIPIKDVAGAISEASIIQTATTLDTALRRDFNLQTPRIAVTGLNPHAGEDGALGNEEINIISPALEKLKAAGIMVSGPFSADTLFHEDRRQEYDAVITMYHDQALIPIKTLDFHGGVNTTLGLSYIRTSPDHGTALDLAGKFTASPASLMAAINLAFEMARNRQGRHA